MKGCNISNNIPILCYFSFHWMEEIFTHIEVWGSQSGLHMIWLELEQPTLWPVNMRCMSALTIKEKNEFKNQNGVTVFQATRMEPGGHCGCGFRHIPASLGT